QPPSSADSRADKEKPHGKPARAVRTGRGPPVHDRPVPRRAEGPGSPRLPRPAGGLTRLCRRAACARRSGARVRGPRGCAMTGMDLASAVSFAVLLPTLLVAHEVADQWVQTHHQACHKGAPGWAGRWECAKHVATYTLVTALAVLAVWGLFALPLTVGGVVAGQVVSAVTHYWADRRATLARLADVLGKGG